MVASDGTMTSRGPLPVGLTPGLAPLHTLGLGAGGLGPTNTLAEAFSRVVAGTGF